MTAYYLYILSLTREVRCEGKDEDEAQVWILLAWLACNGPWPVK